MMEHSLNIYFKNMFTLICEAVRDVHNWATDSRPATLQTLQRLAKLDIVLTSSFSGVGTFECSTVQAMQELRRVLCIDGGEPNVTGYAAWDSGTAARKVLIQSRFCEHVFGDVLDRLTTKDHLFTIVQF